MHATETSALRVDLRVADRQFSKTKNAGYTCTMKKKAPIFAVCVALELVSVFTTGSHGVGASRHLLQAAPLNTTSSRPSLFPSLA